MQKLYLITVPGLDVRSDWRVLHDRLLDEFPAMSDVLATTITATILIVYAGAPDADAWLESITETVLGLRQRARSSAVHSQVVSEVKRMTPENGRSLLTRSPSATILPRRTITLLPG
jgi:hypothetical protein